MTLLKRATTAAAALGLAFVPLTPALAQDATEEDQMQPEMQMQQAEFTEDKLESFVDAAIEVQALTETYVPRVQAAETEAEQQTIAEEANAEIRGAIEDAEGITLEEYVAIGEAAQGDPALAQRITAMVEERAGEEPEG